MKPNRTILLTFDIEEFDLPLEYNKPIAFDEQMMVGKRGLDNVMQIIANQQVVTTMFVTGRFALQFSDTIKQLSRVHEIASHSFSHTSFEKGDLLKSRLALEQITGKPVIGLRMPRMQKVSMEWVKEAGYSYDSSINPTYIPGRYNNCRLPRTWYREEGMLRLPTSVSPNLRIPLFWLAFKNFPYSLYKILALQTLKKDGYLSLYFHGWEFTDVSRHDLPFYTKKHSGNILIIRLNKLITDLKNEADFSSVQSYIEANSLINCKAL